MFGTALVPINFRESLPRLRGLVSFLGKFGTGRLILLHVTSGQQRDRLERRLEELREQLRETLEASHLECEIRLSSGSPPSEVCRVAREAEADYIALPWRRKNWLQRTLAGSFSRDLIRLSDLPLFLYKGGGYGSWGESPREAFVVLYATALQIQDEHVLPLLSWPRLQVDRLVLVHAGPRAPDPVAEHRRDQEVSRRLVSLARNCEVPGRLVDTRSVTGKARREILRIARQEGARMLVVGKSEKRRGLAGMVGSVAESVAYDARQSVLIVGAPRGFAAPADPVSSGGSAFPADSASPADPSSPGDSASPRKETDRA